jgi:mono-ADP-ribosyltransferase sirtuin 6
MAILGLYRAGIVKHVVSQNVDGLHLRSGLPRTALSELHGNIFAEACVDCCTHYYRDDDVEGMGLRPTGRRCQACGGVLCDLTYDWDSVLPEIEFANADAAHRGADVALVLGTSLRIRPAGNMPMKTVRLNGKAGPGRLVIVNLQHTHLDRHATIRIRAKLDVVFARVMALLGIAIPAQESVTIPPFLPSLLQDRTTTTLTDTLTLNIPCFVCFMKGGDCLPCAHQHQHTIRPDSSAANPG